MTIIYWIAFVVFATIALPRAIDGLRDALIEEIAIKHEEQILDAKHEILDKIADLERQIVISTYKNYEDEY